MNALDTEKAYARLLRVRRMRAKMDIVAPVMGPAYLLDLDRMVDHAHHLFVTTFRDEYQTMIRVIP